MAVRWVCLDTAERLEVCYSPKKTMVAKDEHGMLGLGQICYSSLDLSADRVFHHTLALSS